MILGATFRRHIGLSALALPGSDSPDSARLKTRIRCEQRNSLAQRFELIRDEAISPRSRKVFDMVRNPMGLNKAHFFGARFTLFPGVKREVA